MLNELSKCFVQCRLDSDCPCFLNDFYIDIDGMGSTEKENNKEHILPSDKDIGLFTCELQILLCIVRSYTVPSIWPVIITDTVFHTVQLLAQLLVDNLTVCWLIVRWLARLSSDETYLMCQYEHMAHGRCCNLLRVLI